MACRSQGQPSFRLLQRINLNFLLFWKFKWGIDTLHPVYANLFKQKKKALEEGGIFELERTTSGGRDLSTLLSTYSLRRQSLRFQCFPISVSANQLADEEDRMPDDVVISNMRSAWCPWDIKLFWTLLQLHCPRRTRNDFRRSFSAPVFDSQRQWHTKSSAQRTPWRWCRELYQVCFQEKLYWPASSYRPRAMKGSITMN